MSNSGCEAIPIDSPSSIHSDSPSALRAQVRSDDHEQHERARRGGEHGAGGERADARLGSAAT